jgi:hypothetical protein
MYTGHHNKGGGSPRYGVNGERRPETGPKTAGTPRAASAMGNRSAGSPQRHGQLPAAPGTLRAEQARSETPPNPHGPTMQANIGKSGTVDKPRVGGGKHDLRTRLADKGYASGAQDVARFADGECRSGFAGHKIRDKNNPTLGLG